MTLNPLFAIIQFGETDGGGVSIVDSKWLTPRRREVFWPPVKGSKTFDKILQGDKTPDEKWKIYGVQRIFCETNNINEAKRKLKLSETTSDLEIEETEVVVGKRHIKRKIYSSDEEEDDQFVRPPSLKKKDLTKIEAKLAIKDSITTKQKQQEDLNIAHIQLLSNPIVDEHEFNPDQSKTPTNEGTEETRTKEETGVQISNGTVLDASLLTLSDLPSGLLQGLEEEIGLGQQVHFDITETSLKETRTTSPHQTSSSILTAYQSKVLALLAIIKTQNNQILDLLKQNKARERGVLPNVFKFPITTEEELNSIEDLLKNKENYGNLVAYLKTFGGHDCSTKVKRVLKYVLNDNVACAYNYYGHNRSTQKKKPFNKLTLRECIVETVVGTTSGCTVKDVEDIIKSWLKHAPERQKKNI